jgi:hypothetical protein
MITRVQGEDQLGGATALGTRRVGGMGSVLRENSVGAAELNGSSGVELDAQASGQSGGVAEAVIADGAQPTGQAVAQVATRELHARPGQGPGFVVMVAV